MPAPSPDALVPDALVMDLVEEYPFLVEFLASYNPRFRLLKNPVMRKTVGRVATLARAAEMGGVDLAEFLEAIRAEVERQTANGGNGKGAPPEPRSPGEAGARGVRREGEARAEGRDRVAELKGLIRDLHGDLPAGEARARFDDLVGDVSPQELGSMEEELIREGLPVEEIQRLCDLHVSVVRGALDRQKEVTAPPGHPAHTCMAENRVITELANRLGELCGGGGEDEAWGRRMEGVLTRLSGIHKHYQRKENELFPVLERHGITGPSQVMWGVHDEIRDQLGSTRQALTTGSRSRTEEAGAALARSVIEMVYKEDKILLPLALETLSQEEWAAVRRGEDELGYPFAEPKAPYPGRAAESSQKAADPSPGRAIPSTSTVPAKRNGSGLSLPIVSGAPTAPLPEGKDAYLDLGTGKLSLEQVDMILRHLPVDLSFVDADGFVRYYSETPERLFPRTPGAIGRHVTNCHPPKSVHMVEEILQAFASGEREVAEFWIQMQERFIHIRYFAVRNPGGEYLGCLEVSQDVTAIRQLEGEQRLLDWS